MNSLSGKTALVTSASRGIGRACALALAKAGAQVLGGSGSGHCRRAASPSTLAVRFSARGSQLPLRSR
jgi:NAD(P)-dependent dehydrogenase (short-subunit alcohol dehydrogenase family)